ncbi:MAG: hypothetical protein ACWGOX_13610 [Desulforhopalus sp.]
MMKLYPLLIKSDLHQEINRRFREANIEIAFPLPDLPFHSGDNPLINRHGGVSETDERIIAGKA